MLALLTVFCDIASVVMRLFLTHLTVFGLEEKFIDMFERRSEDAKTLNR